MTISTLMMNMAAVTSVQRTHAGSSWARCTVRAAAAVVASSGIFSLSPALEQGDEHERDQGDDEQDDRDRGRLPVGELLEPRHHQDRRDLGAVGHVARDEDD